MEVFKNEYATLAYNMKNEILEQIWNQASANMKDEDYKMLQNKTLTAFGEYKASKMYVDINNLHFTISPELQRWTNEQIVQGLISHGIEKIAYKVSTDIFAQISVEQALEEDNTQKFPARFFEDEFSAFNWLTNN